MKVHFRKSFIARYWTMGDPGGQALRQRCLDLAAHKLQDEVPVREDLAKATGVGTRPLSDG